MNTESLASIEDRLDRLELEVRTLKSGQTALAAAVGNLRGEVAHLPAAPRHAPKEPPPELAREAVCPKCNGGNPPLALRCMWCGAPMPLADTVVLRPVSTGPAVPGRPAPPPVKWPVSGPLAPAPTGESTLRTKRARPQPAPIVPAVPITPEEMPVPGAVTAETPVTPVTPAAAEPVLPAETLPAPLPRTRPPTPARLPRFNVNFDILGKSEFWFKFLGIGLLLLGLAFFFKYSIDKGWLNEPVRIGLGLALGSVLLGFGLAFHRERRRYSQVLLGGSIATYYITGFAAWTLFHLVDYGWAFGFMALVTALAFVLAVRQDEAVLALIGVTGGLLTPFVLPAEPQGIVGLITYTCVVLAGATAIYFFRGWRTLLWLSYVGGWAVFALGWLGTVGSANATSDDRWALQAGTVFGLLAFWAVPVLREVLTHRQPDRWPNPALGPWPALAVLPRVHVYVLAIAAPLVALGFSRLVWGDLVTLPTWGWWTLAPAAAYGLVAWTIRRPLPQLAYTHAMMAILLATLGLVQILEGNALIASLAIEGAALLLVSYRLSDRGTEIYGHLIWAGAATWLLTRLLYDLLDLVPWFRSGTYPALGPDALTNLAVIVLLAVASFAIRPADQITAYRNTAHLAILIWIAEQLSPLPNWPGLFMLAAAAYAVALNAVYHGWPKRFTAADTTKPAHAILAAAACVFAGRIVTGQVGDWAVFNVKTLIDAAFVAVVAGMSFFAVPRQIIPIYRIAAHVGVLALLWRELWVLDNGSGYALLAWVAYLALVQYLGRRSRDVITASAAHLPFIIVAAWFVERFLSGSIGPLAVLNLNAILDLAAIGLMVGISFLVRPREMVLAYRAGAHLAFLAWLWRELSPLSVGYAQVYVMLAWAVYGLALHYLATRMRDAWQAQGITTLTSLPFVGAGLLFVSGLLLRQTGTPVFNLWALIALACLGLALAATVMIRDRLIVRGYGLVVHVLLLGWLAHELLPLDNGAGWMLLSWAVYALLLHYLAESVFYVKESRNVSLVAHATFVLVAAVLAERLRYMIPDPNPVLNWPAATDLAVIGILLGAVFLARPAKYAWIYGLASHIALLAWFWRELSPLENGNAYISIAWGAVGIAVVLSGLWGTRNMLRVYAGIATLLLVVAKLFLIDLSALDPLWRVLLFMGFGGVFLWLSYYFQNVIRGKPGGTGTHKFGRLHWPGHPA